MWYSATAEYLNIELRCAKLPWLFMNKCIKNACGSDDKSMLIEHMKSDVHFFEWR